MAKIDSAQFDEGQAAYARGATLRGLVEATERLETTQPDNEDVIPSLLIGFGEGLLADIRAISESIRGNS